MENGLDKRLAEIKSRIDRAARSSGRHPAEIQLIAVSKTHPPDAIKQLYDLGVRTFGENKVQEADGKVGELDGCGIEWHLIGHLQSNKARRAVHLFDVIQSLDSLELAERLERICGEEGRTDLKVFVEVDLAGEETKNGISSDKLPELASYLQSCKSLKLAGLMVLPPFFDNAEDTRPFFRELRQMRDMLAKNGAFISEKGELSMGMSHDFEVAIEEGATMVRVGTALFGGRQI